MTSLSKKLLLCFCLCFVFVEAARAQYRFDRWTTDDGLPQNSVNSIVQTGDGYLWLATVDGLARFDGVRFSVFNRSNSPGIVNNRFISLFEDARGDLWAGTEESGAVRFHQGRFTSYGEAEGVQRTVNWIGGAPDGSAIMFSGDQANHFQDGRFAPFDAQTNFSEPARTARRRSIRIFCGDAPNVIAVPPQCFAGGHWVKFSAANLPNFRVLWAAQNADGEIWAITVNRELVRIENGQVTGVFDERNGLPGRPAQLLTGAGLFLLSKDAAGSIWLIELPAMRNELLYKNGAGQPPLDDDELSFSSYVDGEGNFWFGTLRGGLIRARKQVVNTRSKADGLAENNVYPIYEDRAGTIWAGTTNGLFTYRNGIFEFVKSTENFTVNAIGEDAAGRILISNSHGIYVQDGDRFAPFREAELPATDTFFAIHRDRDGALWFGGFAGLLRLKDGVLKTYKTEDGLAGYDVKVITEAKSGGLWIGTYSGLTRFENGRLTSWTEADGLPNRTIRALYEDREGALWIGTYDGGLARFKDGKFTHYDTKIGLYNDGAFQILEDERRNFWISSNRGIYRVNKDELNDYADGKRDTITSIAYGKSDGMLNIECNGGRSPAGFKSKRDGTLWFPTQDGVAIVNPETIEINRLPPPVVIETVRVDNQKTIPTDGEIKIVPGQENLEIDYTGLSFIKSEQVRFRYRLEGLEDNWTEAGTRRTAFYPHIAPGEYKFQVIAANRDNVWNETGATLKITVKPPFYQTWYFIAVCAAAFVLFVFGIYRTRVSRLKKAQHAQEEFSRRLINAHETERRRIAGELHDSIGQSLAMIKNRAVFSQMKSADEQTREHLEIIAAQTSQTIHEVREISYNLRPYLLERLGLTQSIKSLVDEVADLGLIKIAADIDDIDDLFDAEKEMNLFRIIQECVNNVVKHSEADFMSVSIKKEAAVLTISIKDNGKGFDPNESAANEYDKGGFGLIGMAERVKIFGGRKTIESAAGSGTKVLIVINLDKQVKIKKL